MLNAPIHDKPVETRKQEVILFLNNRDPLPSDIATINSRWINHETGVMFTAIVVNDQSTIWIKRYFELDFD